MIVKPSTDEKIVVNTEAQRLNQMKRTARVGTQANSVAGIGRNFWMNENDVKHGVSVGWWAKKALEDIFFGGKVRA